LSARIRARPRNGNTVNLLLRLYYAPGNVDFLLRIVAAGIKAYEQFFFEKLSQLPGIQEVTYSIVMSDIKHSTALPI
jgi:Lrp/AsnC family transcriptional regulator